MSQCLESSGKPGLAFPSLRRGQAELVSLRSALAALYAGGYSLNWNKIYPQGGAFVKLPRILGSASVSGSILLITETLESSVSAVPNSGQTILQSIPHAPRPAASRRSKILEAPIPLLQHLSGMEAEAYTARPHLHGVGPGFTFPDSGQPRVLKEIQRKNHHASNDGGAYFT